MTDTVCVVLSRDHQWIRFATTSHPIQQQQVRVLWKALLPLFAGNPAVRRNASLALPISEGYRSSPGKEGLAPLFAVI